MIPDFFIIFNINYALLDNSISSMVFVISIQGTPKN